VAVTRGFERGGPRSRPSCAASRWRALRRRPFLAGLAIYRKAWSLARRWTDAHVPLVVEPGHYEDVARDLDDALSAAGLDVTPRPAPSVMSRPAQWLARIAGRESAALVPDHMVQLHGLDLDVLVYPMDLLISGTSSNVMRARAAMASRLTTSSAHLTVSAEAQGIEDRLTRLARGATSDNEPVYDDATAVDLGAIDHLLATVQIPYDEWEVLYRQRLQVERDLEPVRWPGRPPRSRSSNRSSACCGRAPRPSRRRPPTTLRSRPSIGSLARSDHRDAAGGRRDRDRPSLAAMRPTGSLRERASRRRGNESAQPVGGRAPGTLRRDEAVEPRVTLSIEGCGRGPVR
jgi:hypothetical protein